MKNNLANVSKNKQQLISTNNDESESRNGDPTATSEKKKEI